MQAREKNSRFMLIAAMVIFGTIGILRKYIPYASSLIALVRAVVGVIFLAVVIAFQKKGMDTASIKRNWKLLLFSGAAMGFNWILLFEAYCHTSVAAATLCYYMAPTLVILASPVFFRERLTPARLLCCLISLAGMVLVSGVADADFQGVGELKGVGLALGAALLYAAVIVMNKAMSSVPAFGKTLVQLFAASAALLPYVLFTGAAASLSLSPIPVILLLTAGVLHTGAAYTLYFGAIPSLSSQSIAMLSYIDPILAVLLSALLLAEPMTLSTALGAVLILGATIVSEKVS